MITQIEMRFFESAISFFNRDKKIDWEQRRYEIAKDIVAARFGKDYGSFKDEDVAPFAVRMADDLIKELKK